MCNNPTTNLLYCDLRPDSLFLRSENFRPNNPLILSWNAFKFSILKINLNSDSESLTIIICSHTKKCTHEKKNSWYTQSCECQKEVENFFFFLVQKVFLGFYIMIRSFSGVSFLRLQLRLRQIINFFYHSCTVLSHPHTIHIFVHIILSELSNYL